jgi:hypothetical protein
MPLSFHGGDVPVESPDQEIDRDVDRGVDQNVQRAARPVDPEYQKVLRARAEDPSSYGIDESDGADPNSLADTGWGIIFPQSLPKAQTDAILKALDPLIQHRAAEVGEDPETSDRNELFKIYRGDQGYRAGDFAGTWLGREPRNVMYSTVGTHNRVPYYLLIVGSPQDIPWDFQTSLDLFWAVGRIWFDAADEYGKFGKYARSVVEFETAKEAPTQRKAAVFATQLKGDPATSALMEQLVVPLLDGTKHPDGKPKDRPLGQRQNFPIQRFLGGDAGKGTPGASRDVLTGILNGTLTGGTPALLFTGTHGRAPSYKTNPRYAELLGAPISQEWNGVKPPPDDCVFTAENLTDDAHVHGMIHFLFACFGIGSPEKDIIDGSELAPKATLSRLPQKLLTHKNGGALAVFGHIDKAFPTTWQTDAGTPQITNMRMVLNNLINGDRIGNATDDFNFSWVAQSQLISEAANQKEKDARWLNTQDARCFAVFGDPAVRLRV